jgi:hypothetical protein
VWEAADARGAADVPAPLDVVSPADSSASRDHHAPVSDTTVDGLAAVALRVRAADDHGLARVALRVTVERAAGGRDPARVVPLVGVGGPGVGGRGGGAPAGLHAGAG